MNLHDPLLVRAAPLEKAELTPKYKHHQDNPQEGWGRFVISRPAPSGSSGE